MNITIHARPNECEVWAPTQSPDWVQRTVAEVLGLSPEKVMVHTTLMGGGFGRRYMADYPAEAAQLIGQSTQSGMHCCLNCANQSLVVGLLNDPQCCHAFNIAPDRGTPRRLSAIRVLHDSGVPLHGHQLVTFSIRLKECALVPLGGVEVVVTDKV